MNTLQRLEQWGDTHHPKWLDIIRIILGIFLCWKGIDFLRNMGSLHDLLANKLSFGAFTVLMLGHVIAFAHILGGALMATGIFTRFACLIQIPVLIGAIILNSQEMFKPYSELFLSVLVLLLLCYFLVVGNGPIAFRFTNEDERAPV